MERKSHKITTRHGSLSASQTPPEDYGDVSHILAPLNKPQCKAVCSEAKNLLVLAGAGSGKTRVLTHRVAWLVQETGCSPLSVLAVTFTNRAAKEMRGRIESLLRRRMPHSWIGTFHSICYRMLRMHWQEAGLREGFQVLADDDQKRLIRRITQDMELDVKQWEVKETQEYISNAKDNMQRADDIKPLEGNERAATMVRLYREYEFACIRTNMVDFSEMLLRCFETLQRNTALRKHYRDRFQHILVDEFQDTNLVQYEWLKILRAPGHSLTVVGDDDQSIYSWRGARVENIRGFMDDFPDARMVRLERNYRSTDAILQAANTVISNNTNRLGKNLWTKSEQGKLLSLYAAPDEWDEARFVTERLQSWRTQGNALSDAAVLYRTNAQSRALETALLRENLPYHIHKGLRFYERKEIRDALAWLGLLLNHDNDTALLRAIQAPPQGIGARTLEKLRETAEKHDLSLWRAISVALKKIQLNRRIYDALILFTRQVEELTACAPELALHEIVESMLEKSGLLAYYQERDSEEITNSRIDNLQELVAACHDFTPEELVEENPTTATQEEVSGFEALQLFLDQVALNIEAQEKDDGIARVQLMTLHAAKGLEFPLVFLTGMEEGLFPHTRSMDTREKLEEERRLCYVGITRAMQELCLSHAEFRYSKITAPHNYVSRFVGEIPQELLQEAERDYNSVEEPPAAGLKLKKQERPSQSGIAGFISRIFRRSAA